MVKLVVGGQSFELDEETKKLMEYVTDLEAIEKKDEIVVENISKGSLEKVLEASKIVHGKFPEVTKIKGSNAEEYIGKDLAEFLSKQPNNELNAMYKTAQFLKMRGMKDSIVAFLACRVYITQKFESYEAKKKELGITKELTTELSQAYKARCNFL